MLNMESFNQRQIGSSSFTCILRALHS